MYRYTGNDGNEFRHIWRCGAHVSQNQEPHEFLYEFLVAEPGDEDGCEVARQAIDAALAKLTRVYPDASTVTPTIHQLTYLGGVSLHP